jgi:hypothetical protein
MKKSFAAALAFAFALGPVAALADDKTPSNITPEEQAKLKADRAAAKAAAAKLTPEEKKAARQAKAKQKEKEVSQTEKVGNIPSGPQKAEAIQKNAASTKTDPKALPTKESKQKALTEQEKKSSGQ